MPAGGGGTMKSTPPFCQLRKAIMARRDLRATDKVLHAYLGDRIGNNGDCWPGQRAIMLDCGMARNTVIASAERLERARLIEIVRGGPHQTNRYRLAEVGGSESAPPNGELAAQGVSQGGSESEPLAAQRVRQIKLQPDSITNSQAKSRKSRARRSERNKQQKSTSTTC